MKLILKEYLASLKERGDLDKSVLPNLLSESGLRVLNTPMIGTRQNGVDIAAVGRVKGEDSEPFLYLFCVKAGNVTRRDWEAGEHAVRPELNEIKDVYLRSNIAKEQEGLPIKICLCFGGEMEETIRTNWAGYTVANTTDKIRYEEWNGDRLAELMMRSLLARELLDEEPRRDFQKAVAMVNEPDICYEYTHAFLVKLLEENPSSKKDQLLKLRQSYICLNAVITWAIEADNLESTYKVSELGLLFCWHTAKSAVEKRKPTKHERALMLILDQFLRLYLTTSSRYFEKVAYAHCESMHALSVAVKSREPVDINLALFELLGRLALGGIWTDLSSKLQLEVDANLSSTLNAITVRIVDTIVSVIRNNPILSSPIKDDHMIEIALVMYLAQVTNSVRRFAPWLEAIADKTTFALISNSRYPTCRTHYDDLLLHPVSHEQEYIDEACAGSVLYPYLYFWMQSISSELEISRFVERLNETIPNCTHQAWIPDADTEDLIWCGKTYHGICITDLSPDKDRENFIRVLNTAVENCAEISEVSAIKLGLIPMFLTACRHYRLPIPPNLWVIET